MKQPLSTTLAKGMHAQAELAEKVNGILNQYPAKCWNYSRINLVVRQLQKIDSPYCLWCELVDPGTEQGQQELKNVKDEIRWGDRHSDELGILEIINLRLNKALFELAPDANFNSHMVIRVISRQYLASQCVEHALWYEVAEVEGEDFENR